MHAQYEEESIYQLLPQQQPVLVRPPMYKSKVHTAAAPLQTATDTLSSIHRGSMTRHRHQTLTLRFIITFVTCSTPESSCQRPAAGVCDQQQQWASHRCAAACPAQQQLTMPGCAGYMGSSAPSVDHIAVAHVMCSSKAHAVSAVQQRQLRFSVRQLAH